MKGLIMKLLELIVKDGPHKNQRAFILDTGKRHYCLSVSCYPPVMFLRLVGNNKAVDFEDPRFDYRVRVRQHKVYGSEKIKRITVHYTEKGIVLGHHHLFRDNLWDRQALAKSFVDPKHFAHVYTKWKKLKTNGREGHHS